MRKDFIQLHASIVLAGFTGVLGKVITLGEGLLVWYRLLISAVVVGLILGPSVIRKDMTARTAIAMMAVGALLALHWVFFFGSIKASNVSVGVVCLSSMSLFTALAEPLINRRAMLWREVGISLLPLAGIALVFSFDIHYRKGIALGLVGALLAALFTVMNKKVSGRHASSKILFYEMVGGFICLTFMLPLYVDSFTVEGMAPGFVDFIWLLVFSLVCTVALYLLFIESLKTIPSFTVNLSYNLEPLYSILIAIVFLGEAKELGVSFYVGLMLILVSVVMQTRSALKEV
ncbi:MAG: DMT family transporter [Tannerellaceae bacterium]|nr:DMT family transporter [Tannerellaceae bacterium]